MSDRCGCEIGTDCTKTTVCQLNNAVEEVQEELQTQIDSLQQKVHLCTAYDKLEAFVQKCADVKNDEGWQGTFWKEARQLLAGGSGNG